MESRLMTKLFDSSLDFLLIDVDFITLLSTKAIIKSVVHDVYLEVSTNPNNLIYLIFLSPPDEVNNITLYSTSIRAALSDYDLIASNEFQISGLRL
ncbi:MAG: hypothetical protein IPM51_12145 [Sphingobacteriaceae bacterium]|nr:hypothetical protein [Sphingobacteriaceae bacterium]